MTRPSAWVFRGSAVRAQLYVYDVTGSRFHWQPTVFRVRTLANDRSKYTTFSCGTMLYFGPDFGLAWRAVQRAVGPVRIPESLRLYEGRRTTRLK